MTYIDVYGNIVYADKNIIIIADLNDVCKCFVTGDINEEIHCKNDIDILMISEDVQNIKCGMFSGLHNLKSVVLPKNLISIEDNAFKDCVSLNNIYIPDSVEYISDTAFSGCDSVILCVTNEKLYISLQDTSYKDNVVLLDSADDC